MGEPTPSPQPAIGPTPGHADGLSRRTAKALVIAMAAGMVGLILGIALLSPRQVRFPLDPSADWNEALVVDRSAEALRTLGHTPLTVVRPNPDDPANAQAAVADDPANPIYQTIYWEVREDGGEPTRRWRVTVKRLGDEFIGWPRRAE